MMRDPLTMLQASCRLVQIYRVQNAYVSSKTWSKGHWRTLCVSVPVFSELSSAHRLGTCGERGLHPRVIHVCDFGV